MNTIGDFDKALAARIHAERMSRGWSIAELADRSDVSKAMISRIERAEASPTATLLVKLATALNLTLAGLLLRLDQATGRVSRRAGQATWTDPETGYLRRQVLALPDHPTELAEICLPGGRSIRFPASAYAFLRQSVWVLDGRLEITEGDQTHTLDAGDCLAFGAPSDVILANPEDTPCRYLVVLHRH